MVPKLQKEYQNDSQSNPGTDTEFEHLIFTSFSEKELPALDGNTVCKTIYPPAPVPGPIWRHPLPKPLPH